MQDVLKQNYAAWADSARKGDEDCGRQLSYLMCGCLDSEDAILPEPEDEEWLTALADKGWLPAIKLLLNAERCEYRHSLEPFEDEDTHEIFDIDRITIANSHPIFDLSAKRRQELTRSYLLHVSENRSSMNVDELKEAYDFLSSSDDLIDTSIVSDTAARYIGLIEELISRDGAEWKETLGELYYCGKPGIGIFRDSAKAQEYDPELGTYEHCDDDICSYTLGIHGTRSQLDGIQTLLGRLCEKWGTPDNELGMFVPIDALIKTLVGSDEYRGNVMRMELSDDALSLQIECEADVADVLKYALQCAFGELKIDLEER